MNLTTKKSVLISSALVATYILCDILLYNFFCTDCECSDTCYYGGYEPHIENDATDKDGCVAKNLHELRKHTKEMLNKCKFFIVSELRI